MAGQPHRRKKQLERITLEELASDPSLSGMLSIFKLPVTGPPIPGYAPESTTVPVSGTVPETGTVDHTESPQQSCGEPETGTVVETGTVPVSTQILESVTKLNAPRRVRIYRATLAQDGHSSGEQILLDTLWRLGKPDGKESKTLTIGYDRLAAECRLNWKSVKAGLVSLERKLALETIGLENSSQRIGRTYRIFSYLEILARRRRAGLVWARKTRGVELFRSQQEAIAGSPPKSVPVSGTVPETGTVGVSGTVPETPTGTVPETPTVSVPETGTVLIGIDSNAFRHSSSSSSVIVEALRQHASDVDDDAVRRLVSACRNYVADASDDEIIHFIHAKAGNPGIRKPLGFILTAVPRCFEGESFRQFRAEALRRREEETRRQEAFRQQAQLLLEDPKATDEEKQWAKDMLDSLSTGSS